MHNMISLAADLQVEKTAGLAQTLWRHARRPFLGAERAAVGAERQAGQLGAKTDAWAANQVTRSGMSRDTHNEIMRKWWENPKNKELIDDYYRAHPNAKRFAPAPPAKGEEGLMSTFEQFQQGMGKYKGQGSQKSLIEAQRLKDLEASYAGFGKDTQGMVQAQKMIDSVRAQDMSAKPLAALGGIGGAYTGYQEGGIQGALAGAAAGATLGYGGGRGLAKAMRAPEQKALMEASKGLQKKIMKDADKGQLGARLNYNARRAADFFTEKGRYQNLGQRLRFGRLGGGHIFGRGGEQIGARLAQGGVLGKGGLLRAGVALDPRIGMNYKLMRQALSQGDYGTALRLGKDVGLGAGMQAGKVGLMGALPAGMVVGDMMGDDPDRSFGQRLGRSVANNAAMLASYPLGMLTWAPSMALGEDYSLYGQAGNLGEYLGGAVGGKGGTAPQQLPVPAVPQQQQYATAPQQQQYATAPQQQQALPAPAIPQQPQQQQYPNSGYYPQQRA